MAHRHITVPSVLKAETKPCRPAPAGLGALSRRQIAPHHHPADIAQGDERVLPFDRAFGKVRQGVGYPDKQIGQLDSRQAHQLDDCRHSHGSLHSFSAAPIAAFWRRPSALEEAAALLAAGRGGVLHRRAEPRTRCGGDGSTCGHQPTNGAKRPEARTGLAWMNGGDGADRLIVSYAPESGSDLARHEPGPAVAAMLRIERLTAEPFAKPLSVLRLSKTEDNLGDVVPLDRMVARTQRKPAAEFVDHVVVRALDPARPGNATARDRGP